MFSATRRGVRRSGGRGSGDRARGPHAAAARSCPSGPGTSEGFLPLPSSSPALLCPARHQRPPDSDSDVTSPCDALCVGRRRLGGPTAVCELWKRKNVRGEQEEIRREKTKEQYCFMGKIYISSHHHYELSYSSHLTHENAAPVVYRINCRGASSK